MSVSEKVQIDELKATGNLPSPTGVALSVLQLTQQDDVSVQELARVLQADPALSGRILKCANSVKYNSGQAIVALSDAVVRLGLRMVRQLSLGFSLLSNHHKGACEAFDYPRFWSLSLSTGVAMQLLNQEKRVVMPEEAFSFGLLSKIGQLALASVHPVQYSEILVENNWRPFPDLLESEQAEFAVDQFDLTIAMLEDWGLPPLYLAAIDCFREHLVEPPTGSMKEEKLAAQLRLAVQMARICVSDEKEKMRYVSELFSLGDSCGIEQARLGTLYDEVVAEWQSWGEILNVSTSSSQTLAEINESVAKNAEGDSEGDLENGALRILIVDDSPIDLRFLAANLVGEGHTVATALNGSEGMALALEFEPHIIMTDLVMPDMNGLELCRALREAKKTQQIYVIMLTGDDSKEKLVEAFEAGADDHIIKPFDPQNLQARIRAARRIVNLQEKVEKDKDEIQRFAAELSIANRKLKHTSFTDTLTELPNRRYALDTLAKCWDTPEGKEPSALTCMILDIDHFKRVNDNYGHDVGDVVLKEIAEVLRGSLRGGDVACRFGGEEFLVICDGLDAKNSSHLAERLRKAVAERSEYPSGFNEQITISIGVASRSAGMDNPDQLLKFADKALYAAKRAGRNRVCRAK